LLREEKEKVGETCEEVTKQEFEECRERERVREEKTDLPVGSSEPVV